MTTPELTSYERHQAALGRQLAGYHQSRNRYQFAVTVAIKQGIMGLCRHAPVLDVGCGNPYLGLFRYLKQFQWRGQYVGIDRRISKQVQQWYQNDIIVRTCDLEARLPFPPSTRHPQKEYATAFCIDTMKSVTNKEGLFLEMRRIAAQVVVIGGVTEQKLRTWDCQRLGYQTFDGLPEPWGLWMNRWAEAERSKIDLMPRKAVGWFETDHGVVKKDLGVCRKCGELDYSGQPTWVCACGTENQR